MTDPEKIAVCSTCLRIMACDKTPPEIIREMGAAPASAPDLAELVAAAREAADLLAGRGSGAPLTRIARAYVCAFRLDQVLKGFDP